MLLRHPRRVSLALLTAYIASVSIARGNPWNLENVSLSIQTATTISFASLAGTLYYGGGFASWPNVLPLTLALGGVSGTALLARGVIAPSELARYDPLWVLGALAFVGTAFYATMPEAQGWMRPAGLAILSIGVLPLTMAAAGVTFGKSPAPNDAALIQASLRASMATYTREESPEFKEIEYIHEPRTGTRVGVAAIPASNGTNDIFIAFQGTSGNVDWLKINADIADIPYPKEWTPCLPLKDAKVHRGFLDAWKSIRNAVWKQFTALELRTAATGRIVLCGHSLGGALATVAAMDISCHLEPERRSKVHVISYGSPHVGNRGFVNAFNSTIPNSTRFVMIYDPIPKLMGARFVHVKGEALVTAAGLDNPITAHKNYERALLRPPSPYSLALPALCMVGLLGVSALIPVHHVDAFIGK